MPESEGVLVSGAGGFLGGRVIEILHSAGKARVRAGIRRWASAARIGRFPVEILTCDVMRPDQLSAALQGISSVVHCAVGRRDVIVTGTRNLLEAAWRVGVRRFVHVSTSDVYGSADGDIDEESPLSNTGKEYADAKIEAEEVCREFMARGLSICILRPTIIYGPFSSSWTIEWAERMQAHTWMLAEKDCQGVCNLVYVDDVVAAILLALAKDEAYGEAFNVNGDERPTWRDYFHSLNNALGLPPLMNQPATLSHASAIAMQPARATARFLLNHLQGPIQKLHQRSRLAKALMRRAEQALRTTPTPAEFTLLGRRASFPTDKAKAMLGYEPRFTMEEGIRLSVAWLRHHGYVPSRELVAGDPQAYR